MTNEYSTEHPHDEEPMLDGEGRCLVCSRLYLTGLAGENDYLLSSLNQALNLLDAARTDLMAGQRVRVDDRWFGLVEELDAAVSPLLNPDD